MDVSGGKPAALVLASTRGLGFSCAESLCRRGFPVAITGRSAERVEQAVTRLRLHPAVCGAVGDIGCPEELGAMVDQARASLGPIGILVANGGGPPPGGFEDIDDGQWEAAFHSVLGSFVQAVRLVLPDMRALGRGRIILIASSSIRQPVPNLVLSNTFRPALNGLVKDLSRSLAREQITVNVVAPGRIDTERVRGLDQATAARKGLSVAEVRRESEGRIPMGRYGRADELGALVGFLASDSASYITGQSIVVDGGMTASQP